MAGIDFGLSLISQIVGPEVAGGLQLMAECDSQPATPFGNPAKAPAEMVAAVRAQVEQMAPALTEFFATKNA